jgi:DNA-binding LacI/PurR family transcriptional regulator
MIPAKEVTLMATIDEVATLAKVSVATVSRVMNNNYVVSEEKRLRVLEAAQQLGYQPSTYSRNQKRAEICSPPLTTVAQPSFEIGASTMRLLAQLISGEIRIGRHVMIDHKLKIRESTVGTSVFPTTKTMVSS